MEIMIMVLLGIFWTCFLVFVCFWDGYEPKQKQIKEKQYYCERCGAKSTFRPNLVDKDIILFSICTRCEEEIEDRVREEVRQEIIDSISSK